MLGCLIAEVLKSRSAPLKVEVELRLSWKLTPSAAARVKFAQYCIWVDRRKQNVSIYTIGTDERIQSD